MKRLLVPAALAALVLAGCGGSSKPKGPADLIFVSTQDGDYAIFGADANGKPVQRQTEEKGEPATPNGRPPPAARLRLRHLRCCPGGPQVSGGRKAPRMLPM